MKKRLKTKITILISALMIVLLAGTAANAEAFAVQSEGEESTVRWQDYKGKRIGVLTGTPLETVAEENFADSEILHFNSYPDLSAALLAGIIDAYLVDEPEIKMIRKEQPEIDYIPEKFTYNDYSFAFRKDDAESAALCEQLNEFLAQMRKDGTFQEIEGIWLGNDDSKKTVDMTGLTGENGTIRVATTSTDMPWSYIKDGKNVGYDIDIVVRFCREYGYFPELMDVDFAGRIPAVQSGKCDFSTDMNVTPERKEAVLFSDPTASGGIVLAVKASDLRAKDAAAEPEFGTFKELEGRTVSMLNGSPFEEVISAKISQVKEFTYYQSMPDMTLAIKNGKTDAGFMNSAVAEFAVSRDAQLALLPESLGDSAFGFGFKKGSALRDEWQAAFDSIPSEMIEALWTKWVTDNRGNNTVPAQDWPGNGGMVKIGACEALEPMCYVGEDGQLQGLDIEVILLIAKKLDVRVEFVPMDMSAILSSLATDKVDIVCGSLFITDERKEAADFVEYHPAYYVLIVRSAAGEAVSDASEGIADSFYKTFIREDRYRLFLKGMLTTVTITVLSVLMGTALGFFVYMGCRKGGKASNAITRFLTWLIQGMPVVLLLMILYYVIFAKIDIGGMTVAVIAFTLVFGSGVFSKLKNSVIAIDRGQTEAALSLGYGDVQAFFRVILPQALPLFLPGYKGEAASLLKATAVAGYIAVQDLTKMGDIIRGRTYEAFFPLISVAVIYFVLAGILKFIVNRIEYFINPKRRRREDILKGVRTDD